MTTKWVTRLGRVLCLAVIALSLSALTASAQVRIEFGAPPPEFIATARPVYWNGRAHYWYRGRWGYRDGNRWGSYNEEPGYLRERRERHEPSRYYYGRGGGGHRHW